MDARPTAFIINMHRPGLEVTNDDRSKMVLPLVTTFMEAYGSDTAEQAIADLVADLGHLLDRLPEDEREDGGDRGTDGFASVLERAMWHYTEEVAEEAPEGRVVAGPLTVPDTPPTDVV